MPALLALLLVFQSSLHILSHGTDHTQETQASCQLCLGFQGLELTAQFPALNPFGLALAEELREPSSLILPSASLLLPPSRGPPARS